MGCAITSSLWHPDAVHKHRLANVGHHCFTTRHQVCRLCAGSGSRHMPCTTVVHSSRGHDTQLTCRGGAERARCITGGRLGGACVADSAIGYYVTYPLAPHKPCSSTCQQPDQQAITFHMLCASCAYRTCVGSGSKTAAVQTTTGSVDAWQVGHTPA